MARNTVLVWKGERDRRLQVSRPCRCRICRKNRRGVGYLSSSDTEGRGFTIWITEEQVFQRLKSALRNIGHSKQRLGTPENLRAVYTNCNEGLQNASPPKPDRIELLKQVRHATIDDQLHLLRWLETKFEKIKPAKG